MEVSQNLKPYTKITVLKSGTGHYWFKTLSENFNLINKIGTLSNFFGHHVVINF